MTVMFHDVHSEIDNKIGVMARLEHPLMNNWELIYADDTMIIGKRAREINLILAAIEKASGKYNLRLNYDKCEYIGMNGKAHIHFSNGKPMKEVSQAKYLGGIISNDASRWNDLNNRITKALLTCNKLKIFWSKTNCSHKWKLQVYNAVIISQLTYGLSTVQMTPAMLARLDAFQMRGLRYILQIEHSYYSHVSNQEIYDKINIILNKGVDINITWQEFIVHNRFDNPKTITKVSDYIMKQQGRLLGHVIRAEDDDPMKMPTIDAKLNTPGVWRKRVGRPRLGWVHENCKWTFENTLMRIWDEADEESCVEQVIEGAIARKF